MKLFDLTGRKAIVTGGTRGLGYGMAEGLMEAGAEVVIVGSSDKVQHFRDDKLNDLLTAISAEVDAQKRLQLTGDAQRYLLDNAYVIPIFEEPQVFAGAPWVKGVSFEAVGRPSFYGSWLEKH